MSLQPCIPREYPVKATGDAPGPTATDQGKVSKSHLLMSLSLQCLSNMTELGKWIQKLLEGTAKLARPKATKTHGAFPQEARIKQNTCVWKVTKKILRNVCCSPEMKKAAFFPLCWMGFIRERLPLVTQDVNQGLHEAHAPFVPPQSMLGKHVEFVNLWGIPWKNEVGKKDELLTQGCCKTMKHFWLSCALCQSIRECYHSWIKCRTRLAARCLIWYGNRSKPLHSNICMIKKS